MKAAQIIINNQSYQGSNITIKNGEVYIDNKLVNSDKVINIEITGNCNDLRVDHCNKLLVKGSTNSIITSSGDVTVTGDVNGDVKSSSGDIKCSAVSGSITTSSGDVIATNVHGNVKTVSGDIKR